MRIPDIDDFVRTRPLSMTSCVAINGYSSHQAEASAFAAYLTGEFAENLYTRTGKIPAALDAIPDYENLRVFADEYARSVPLPKLMTTSNFWVQLENTFARIWEGANANEQMRQLAEQIMSQVSGTEVVYEPLAGFDDESEEIEYLDEEALTIEAQED
jgi:maltose-binding protein MalE